ncbi:MAG: hypothetical protein AAFU65_03735 [Pseudomonadota bacterium]
MTRRHIFGGLILATLAAPSALAQAGSGDVDDDGFTDSQDNCVFVANGAQRDTDGDGIGNACDADLNQDCVVNVVDLGLLRSVFFTADEDADFNGDGQVNVVDLGLMRQQFFGAPGPAGTINACVDTLTIAGRVEGDGVTPSALIATVDGTNTDGSVLQSSVTTAADGTFTIEIFAPSTDSYVSLSSVGGGGALRLLSNAGSFGQLQALAVDGTVGEMQTHRVVVSPVSTALAVEMEKDQGGVIRSDTQYLDARKAAGPPTWLRLAALIQSTIDDPAIALPGADTLTVLRDGNLRQMLRDDILLNHLATRDAAAADILASLTAPWSATDAVGTLDLSITRSLGAAAGARAMANSDGTAAFADSQGSFTGTWSLTGNGRLQLTPDSPVLVAESFPFIEDPDNPGMFIQALQQQFLDQAELVRLVDDTDVDAVLVLTTRRFVFPDYPQIPPETFATAENAAAARNAYTASSHLALAAADLAGREIVLGATHVDMQSLGNTLDTFGYDVFTMNVDGTGMTERRNFAFTWSVSPEGVLNIDFANGDSTQFTGLIARGPTIDGLMDGQIASTGDTVLRNATLAFVDRSQALTFADVAGTRWRSELATSTAVTADAFEVFDWRLDFGGVACRNPFSSSTWSWTLNDARVDINRAFPPDFIPSWRRSFETFAREGEQHWVIETLQTFAAGGLLDTGTVAGRINVYRREQTLIGAGNLPPTLVADAFVAPIAGTTVSVRELVANDVDSEGDQIFYMSHTPTGSLGGSLELVIIEGVQGLKYTPPVGVGSGAVEMFSVQASDRVCPVPNGASAALTFTIL